MFTRIEDLPAFRVVHVLTESGKPQLSGVFTRLQGVRAGRSWLYAGDAGSLFGDLVNLDMATGRATFVAPFWTHESPIQVGSLAPWIDGHWQAYHVTMILDPEAGWRRTEFAASAAQHFRVGNAHGWTKLGQELPQDAIPTFVQEDGWDHEHCELCRGKIGRGGQPYGYVDRHDHWVCESCHREYVATRNLAFLLHG